MAQLTDQQLQAMDLCMAYYPQKMTLDQIAEKIGVTDRTLRRWRDSEEWVEEWNKRDLSEIDSALRKQVIERGDAALFKVWYQRHGGFQDEDLLTQALKMTETEAMRIAQDASAWLEAKQSVSSI